MAPADRLAIVLRQENAALEQMDLRAATALLPEKTAALAGLPPDGIAAPDLHALAHLAEENRRLLERAMRAQAQVIEIITRAVMAAAVPPSYGASARVAHRPGPMALLTRA